MHEQGDNTKLVPQWSTRTNVRSARSSMSPKSAATLETYLSSPMGTSGITYQNISKIMIWSGALSCKNALHHWCSLQLAQFLDGKRMNRTWAGLLQGPQWSRCHNQTWSRPSRHVIHDSWWFMYGQSAFYVFCTQPHSCAVSIFWQGAIVLNLLVPPGPFRHGPG